MLGWVFLPLMVDPCAGLHNIKTQTLVMTTPVLKIQIWFMQQTGCTDEC